MKKLIALLSILILFSCESVPDNPPLWVMQDIDREPACEIIPCNGMKIIAMPNYTSFSATYTQPEGNIWFKSDKAVTGLDFHYRSQGMKYYNDSCTLKEDLRAFIKLQMVKYMTEKLY